LRGGAAAIGIAGTKPLGRDRAGEAAGRVGELGGATDDFPGLPHVSLNMQLCGLRENEVGSPLVLTKCIVPSG
jgi:hypothetical protein